MVDQYSTECKHLITQNDRCIQCGELIFATETRPCSECKYFKDFNSDIPLCKKKLMVVTGDMHVYYKIKDGTCFE